MMNRGIVGCVMLTKDRPEMAARAVRSFHSQTYEPMRLLILDTSDTVNRPLALERHRKDYVWRPALQGNTIGALRNEINSWAADYETDIIAHWDSDDCSHPSRIAEQVALLQASGADCVGYNECLFWDTRSTGEHIPCESAKAYADLSQRREAWLYRCPSPTYGLGSSLCYWRRAWEQKPFADINHGEDVRWITGLKVTGVSSLIQHRPLPQISAGATQREDCEPRMICSIHGANTSVYAPEKDRNMWKRAPEWDEYCERTMRL